MANQILDDINFVNHVIKLLHYFPFIIPFFIPIEFCIFITIILAIKIIMLFDFIDFLDQLSFELSRIFVNIFANFAFHFVLFVKINDCQLPH